MNLKALFNGALSLISGVFSSKPEGKIETVTTYTTPRGEYRHTPTGKLKITKHTHVQRINGKVIIHNDSRGGATAAQHQRGFNKILSLHSMFIQRANLTAELRK